MNKMTNILTQMPEISSEKFKDFSEDEFELTIVRIVQNIISPKFKRNISFFYQREDIKKRREIYNKKMNVDNIDRFDIVCKLLCEITRDILKKKYNIDSEIISCDNDEFGHVDLLLKTKSGKKYIINLLSDLEIIQKGGKAKRFASEKYYNERYSGRITDISFIDDETLKKIDDRIKYTYNGLYFDDIIKLLQEEFKQFKEIIINNKDLQNGYTKEEIKNMNNDLETEMKVKFLVKYFNGRSKLSGHIELVRYCKMILSKLFSKEEQNKIKLYDIYIDSKNVNGRISYILKKDDEERKRGLVISTNGKNYAISTIPDRYVEFNEDEWKREVKNNNIGIKLIGKSEIMDKLKRHGANIEILNNGAFKRIIIEEERKESLTLENFIITEKEIEIHGIVFSIEDHKILVVKNKITGNIKRILYEDEHEVIIDNKINVMR